MWSCLLGSCGTVLPPGITDRTEHRALPVVGGIGVRERVGELPFSPSLLYGETLGPSSPLTCLTSLKVSSVIQALVP